MMRISCMGLLIVCLFGCGTQPADPVVVTDARVRAVIPGSDKTVGYFSIKNYGSEPLAIIGASASQVRTIELHETTTIDGVSRMRRLKRVAVAPGEEVHFQPGGKHLMLFGVGSLSEPLTMSLVLEDQSQVMVPVRIFDFTDAQ